MDDWDLQPTMHRDDDGTLWVEWKHQRPRWVRISPELLDQIVAELNAARRDAAIPDG